MAGGRREPSPCEGEGCGHGLCVGRVLSFGPPTCFKRQTLLRKKVGPVKSASPFYYLVKQKALFMFKNIIYNALNVIGYIDKKHGKIQQKYVKDKSFGRYM